METTTQTDAFEVAAEIANNEANEKTDGESKYAESRTTAGLNLPQKLESYMPESILYTQLLELEKKVEAMINRKKFDILEQRSQIKVIRRTLRILVSNVFSNPLAKIQDESPNSSEKADLTRGGNVASDILAPSWTLAIEGKLLDFPRSRKFHSPSQKFSSFIKSIIVKLCCDPADYPEGTVIEWNNTGDTTKEFDGIEIKRKGDKDIPVKILIYLEHKPDVFKLAKPLANLLDIHTDTITGITLALWKYIKSRNLQDREDKSYINCDGEFAQIFNQDRILISELPQIVKTCLLPPDPVVIDYTINTSKEYTYHPVAYDVSVSTINSLAKQKSATLLLASTSTVHKDISVLNRKIQKIIKEIHNTQIRRDLLASFISEPIKFMDSWVASQGKDLEMVLGEPWEDFTRIGQSSLFSGENIRDAISHYLRQKSFSYKQDP